MTLNFGARAHDLVQTPEIQNFETASEFAFNLGKTAKECGLSCVQLALKKSLPKLSDLSNPEMAEKLGSIFKEELSKFGVSIAVLGCYHNMLFDFNSNNDFNSYLESAHFFNTKIVATEPGSVLKEGGFTLSNFEPDTFKNTIQKVTQFCKTAQKTGAIVGIEPGLNHPIYSVESTVQFVENMINEQKSDDFSIIFDPFNFITKENVTSWYQIIDDSFSKFGDKIKAVHLKDFKINDAFSEYNPEIGKFGVEPVSIGKGILNLEKTALQISKYNPELPIIFEHSSPPDIKLSNLRRFAS